MILQGRPSPKPMMHFPYFAVPPSSENFRVWENFPLFSQNGTFPPVSENLVFSPAFQNFPLISFNLPVLNVLYVFFVSPYFDHDAFMHHTVHVLDASGILCPTCELTVDCCSFPPTLTMMHLCIIHCTCWTPLGFYFQ